MRGFSVGRYGRGENGTVVELGPLTVWFSYRTPVAYQVGGGPRVVRQNQWGPTTARHLKEIDGGGRETKAARVPGDQFEEQLEAVLAGVAWGLAPAAG